MQVILSDHNCIGQARQIINTYNKEQLGFFAPARLAIFDDIALPYEAEDEMVWQLCQDNGYLLLTGNRRTNDQEKSLELTIRRLYTPQILPVITVGNLNRVAYDIFYRKNCAVTTLYPQIARQTSEKYP